MVRLQLLEPAGESGEVRTRQGNQPGGYSRDRGSEYGRNRDSHFMLPSSYLPELDNAREGHERRRYDQRQDCDQDGDPELLEQVGPAYRGFLIHLIPLLQVLHPPVQVLQALLELD